MKVSIITAASSERLETDINARVASLEKSHTIVDIQYADPVNIPKDKKILFSAMIKYTSAHPLGN